MNEKIYSIDKAHAHPRAIALLTEDFFWDCADELAPFGSDEGAEALAAFRAWRMQNPSTPTIICLQWTVESVADHPLRNV